MNTSALSFLLTFSFLCYSCQLSAQEKQNSLPISVAYFGQVAIQPGVKVSTSLPLRSWEKDLSEVVVRQHQILLEPGVSYFSWPGTHQSLFVQTELSYRAQKSHRRFFKVFSVGLGYLAEFKVIARRLNLQDGSQTKIRDQRNYFLPTVGLAIGQQIRPALAWYTKLSGGIKMAPNRDRTSMIFLELGLRIHL